MRGYKVHLGDSMCFHVAGAQGPIMKGPLFHMNEFGFDDS